MSAFTDAELLALSATPVAKPGPGTPGTYRGCARHNKVPQSAQTMTTTFLNFIERIPYTIGMDITACKFWLHNFYVTSAGVVLTGNDVVIDSAYLETGFVLPQITFGGSGTLTMASGDYPGINAACLTDEIAVAAARDDVVYLRIQGHVNTANDKIPVGKDYRAVGAGLNSWYYQSTTIMSPTNGTGAIIKTGGSGTPSNLDNIFAPIMIGKTVVDGVSFISLGASQGAGTGSTYGAFGSSFIQNAMQDANGHAYPLIECCASGSESLDWIGANTQWQGLLAYARVAIVEQWANESQNDERYVQDLIAIARAGGIVGVVRTGALPLGTSVADFAGASDDQVQNAAQVAARKKFEDWKCNRSVEYYAGLTAVRTSADETSAHYDCWLQTGTQMTTTALSGHMTEAGHTLAGSDLATTLQAVELDFV